MTTREEVWVRAFMAWDVKKDGISGIDETRTRSAFAEYVLAEFDKQFPQQMEKTKASPAPAPTFCGSADAKESLEQLRELKRITDLAIGILESGQWVNDPSVPYDKMFDIVLGDRFGIRDLRKRRARLANFYQGLDLES